MRIVHVIDYFHTDVGYQEFYLAKTMAEAGHEVTVISSGLRQHTVATPIDDRGQGEARLVAAGVQLSRLPARQLGHDRAWLRGLEAALTAAHPDAVHCHGPFSPTTLRTARVCRRQRVPLLVDNHIHEAIAPGSTTALGKAVYDVYRWTVGPVLRRSVGDWVANGPYEADFLEHRLGLARGSVGLVPLGFDPATFGADPARGQAFRQQQGWGDEMVVAITGKLHAGKRPDLVARACESVQATRPVRLVVAGTIDPDAEEAVRQAAPVLLGNGRLDFLPMLPAPELADLYRAADVVVFARLPSISIYEAAGTGARVLVGRDRFADWLAGLHRGIVAVDPADLAPALDPPANRARLAADAAAAFSWAVVSQHFCDRYRRIATGA